MPGMSVYCGAKAGLHMFAQGVGLEQAGRGVGFEVHSIGPGKVETSMQRTIRSKRAQEFALVEQFKQAFEQGDVSEPTEVSATILAILQARHPQGKYVSVRETWLSGLGSR